jgi:hypothetical protein
MMLRIMRRQIIRRRQKYLYSIKKIQKLNAENNAKFLNLKIKGSRYFEANE